MEGGQSIHNRQVGRRPGGVAELRCAVRWPLLRHGKQVAPAPVPWPSTSRQTDSPRAAEDNNKQTLAGPAPPPKPWSPRGAGGSAAEVSRWRDGWDGSWMDVGG